MDAVLIVQSGVHAFSVERSDKNLFIRRQYPMPCDKYPLFTPSYIKNLPIARGRDRLLMPTVAHQTLRRVRRQVSFEHEIRIFRI